MKEWRIYFIRSFGDGAWRGSTEAKIYADLLIRLSLIEFVRVRPTFVLTFFVSLWHIEQLK